MATTITRDSLTDDTGSAASPNADGSILNNSVLQNKIYARIDELFAGAGSYTKFTFGGAVQMDGQPRCWAFHSTTQSLANNSWDPLSLDTEGVDVGSMHSTVTNTSRITIPTGQGGYYAIVAQVGFALNSTGIRGVGIRLNGSSILHSQILPAYNTGAELHTIQASFHHTAAAGDYYEVVGFQTSGGALNVGSANTRSAVSLIVSRLY